MARLRDSKGRYLPGTVAVATPSRRSRRKGSRLTPRQVKRASRQSTKALKNHFILVCDGSGSMQAYRGGAAKLFNEQLDIIQNTKDQKNSATVFQFTDAMIDEVCFNAPPSAVERFTQRSYPAAGGTPLYDAVIEAGRRALCDQDDEKSFVMVVLTDGEENESRRSDVELRDFIRQQQATDRWTFVFLVPRGYKSKFVQSSGVHEGNVREWDNIEDARRELIAGAERYMTCRTMGERSSKTWFTTDLSSVSSRDLTKLSDVTGEVAMFTVDKESNIREFVNAKVGTLETGTGFYEIMKKETCFQDYKKLLIMDRATKRIYADGKISVRAMCGFPDTGDVAIDPGNHANFVLFGQSTSTNRILPRGTRLAHWPQAAK